MITGANGIYTYTQSEIDQITEYLQECARRRKIVHYDDAYLRVRDLGAYAGPHDKRLWDLLGIVSGREVEGGRGALSAIVVTKENNRPGTVFLLNWSGNSAATERTTKQLGFQKLITYFNTGPLTNSLVRRKFLLQ